MVGLCLTGLRQKSILSVYRLFPFHFCRVLTKEKKEVKRVITQDSQLGRSQCELSEFVDQVFGLANTGLFSPIPVSFLTLLM